MMHKAIVETVHERFEGIELVVARIARRSEEGDLRDLRTLLVNITGLIKRNPGIEAAADDLYAAATAVVIDSQIGSQPATRKLRLLTEASQRFCRRLKSTAEPEERLTPRSISVLYTGPVAPGSSSGVVGGSSMVSA